MDPYPSMKPIIEAMVGTLIALLTLSVPFIIIVESQASKNDTNTQQRVPRRVGSELSLNGTMRDR